MCTLWEKRAHRLGCGCRASIVSGSYRWDSRLGASEFHGLLFVDNPNQLLSALF
jgi:hypothetical protein